MGLLCCISFLIKISRPVDANNALGHITLELNLQNVLASCEHFIAGKMINHPKLVFTVVECLRIYK